MKYLLPIFILNFVVFAGEVDQYLAWNHLPNDESHYLNKLFNAEIQSALDDINKNHSDCSCEEAAGKVLKHFWYWVKYTFGKNVKRFPRN